VYDVVGQKFSTTMTPLNLLLTNDGKDKHAIFLDARRTSHFCEKNFAGFAFRERGKIRNENKKQAGP
jgi:hypothetical protein